jgi:DNA-binding NarL/FixJ family response regulator
MTTVTAPQSKAVRWKVLVVDEHPVLREGLREFINSQPDLAVCGMAQYATQVLAEVDAAQPDIVITDIVLRGRTSLDLIREIKNRRPSMPVVVFSLHNEMVYSVAALQAGADGFVVKTEPPERLLAEVRRLLPAARAAE